MKTFLEHRGVEWSGSVIACPELRSAAPAMEPFRWGLGCVILFMAANTHSVPLKGLRSP